MATKNTTAKSDPNDLDTETAGGKRLVVRHSGHSFEVADVMNDRTWEEAADLLDDLAGVNGTRAMAGAMKQVLSEDDVEHIKSWPMSKVTHLMVAIGERVGTSVGTSGE